VFRFLFKRNLPPPGPNSRLYHWYAGCELPEVPSLVPQWEATITALEAGDITASLPVMT
jgi:hypothetical protein